MAMWPANVADIAALTAAEIIKNAPTATDEEKDFLAVMKNCFTSRMRVCIVRCR